MKADRQFKVVKLIAQPTGRAGPIADLTEAVAGPFTSEMEAERWIERNREIGTRLAARPIVITPEQV
jgi:hypothetical protein